MKKVFAIGNKITAAFIALFTLLAVFMPSFPMIEPFRDHLAHVLILLMISGLIGLVISNTTVIFTSFGCAMLLAIFLKNASNTDLKNAAPNDQPSIKVKHINLSLIDNAETLQLLVTQDSLVDIISFQEYTPDWIPVIRQLLPEYYHFFESTRIDVFGKAIYSRLPLLQTECKISGDNYDISRKVIKSKDTFTLMSSYVLPALDSTSNNKAKAHLTSIKDFTDQCPSKNFLIFGEFNQVYWSPELMAFRKQSQLLNSRRDVSLNTTKVPYNHIFFKGNIECTHFSEVFDRQAVQVGCTGVFQLKQEM